MLPIKPMLAVRGKPFTAKGWIFEPKIDGTRCIAYLFNEVELRNRRLFIMNYRYPELIRSLKDAINASTRGCVLDGEIAVFSKGVPDFNALAQREHQVQRLRIDYLSKNMSANYIVFDILYSQGKTIMDRPLLERKQILKEILQEGELVTIIDYLSEKGETYFQAAMKLGLEGIMAKKANSSYQPGIRSPNWMKIKKNLTADLVVGGYIPGRGHREPYFGSLLLGAYDSGKLVFIGRVGSGFSEKELKEIREQLVIDEKSPFSELPRIRNVKWVKPELVLEVSAMEVTRHGNLRAPVFDRIRDDKEPQECGIDQLLSARVNR
ncbi:MAG: non-homologous end-joining DNA ligase [Methanotrichaceae archaeon]|nr:non-homologous end-joining DNA ligase [Methanotrichaceae archaeon]